MRFILATLIILFAHASFAEEASPTTAPVPGKIDVQEIRIDPAIRFVEGLNYSEYYGVIRSEKELEKLFSNLTDIREGFFSRLLGISPEPPDVDFERHSVIWFAHKGANASFASSMEAAGAGGAVLVTITAYHTDFGSTGLNLWKIPKTDDDIIFEVVHEYETRGP